LNKETLKAINTISKKVNIVEQKLDGYFCKRHSENVESISVNADGIDDLAETTDISASAIDDLADYVAVLEERIAELENKKG
jgi:hypothetical protein